MPNTVTAASYVMPVEVHDRIITAAYRKRGYTPDECEAAVYYGGDCRFPLSFAAGNYFHRRLDQAFGRQTLAGTAQARLCRSRSRCVALLVAGQERYPSARAARP